MIQVKFCADAGYDEEDRHKPGIDDVLEQIPVLYPDIGNLSGYTRDSFAVIHIKHMV